MRQLFLLCLSIVILTAACTTTQKHDGYIVKGKVTGVESGWVKLIRNNFTDRSAPINVIDSVQLQNGTFEFKGKVEYADEVTIAIGENHYSNFILENCEITLDVKATMNERGRGEVEMTVSGSELNDSLAAQDAIEEKLFTQEKYSVLIELRKEMEAAYSSKDEAKIKAYKERAAQYQDLSNERYQERIDAKIAYAKAHPSSTLAPIVLSFMFSEGRMTKEQMKEIYPIFTGDATHTAMYEYYTKTYDEIFNSMAEGSKVPDFTLPKLGGGELTLSEVKGKYIFIDFWASWCGPCRASFPHLKEVYKKYHKDGFEVVGVGTADQGSRWKKAIEEDQTPWNHVFDGDPNAEVKGKGGYGKVAIAYGVPFLPTTFLVDSDGIIVGRQLRGEDLDAKMKELYGY